MTLTSVVELQVGIYYKGTFLRAEDAPANLAHSQPFTSRLCSPVSSLQSGHASTWELFCSKLLVPSRFPKSPQSCRKGFRPPHSFLRSQAIWMPADKCIPAKTHGTWERRCRWTVRLRSPPGWALQKIPALWPKATHPPIAPCYLQPQKQPTHNAFNLLRGVCPWVLSHGFPLVETKGEEEEEKLTDILAAPRHWAWCWALPE